MAKLKTFKLLSISLSLMAVLSACSLPGGPGLPTQTVNQPPPVSIAAVTEITSPLTTPFPPNTPVWSVYTYTCELVDGGGIMTMNLFWNDRSNSEEGYKVYREKQVIATLAPNSTHYVDVAFVATGKTLSYSVEAFNQDWQVSSSTITYGCQ
jgi:hypothetical protein